MTRTLVAVLLLVAASLASADVWRWTDAHGNVHFVDTLKPIYTWVEEGRVHFSDMPDHEDAVSVQFVWHSSADSIAEVKAKLESKDSGLLSGETEEDRREREEAEAYYCKRAQEIYETYKNAPRLYRTLPSGERQYLTEKESEAQLTETAARVDELCG